MNSDLLIILIVFSIACGLFGFILCCCDMHNKKLNKNSSTITITYNL